MLFRNRTDEPDSMKGRSVEIRSTGGMVYCGVVRSIRHTGGSGELFELGSAENPEYQRLVHVTDRRAQIREIEREP